MAYGLKFSWFTIYFSDYVRLSYDDAKAKASRDRRMDEQLKVLEEVPAQEFVNVGNTSTLGPT